MIPNRKTAGELAFERYLHANKVHDFSYEKLHPGKRKTPDYTLNTDPPCFLDVKDNESRDRPDGEYDPYPWLREQIEQGRRKFREFKGSPCAIVMFGGEAWWFTFMNPEFVFGAMYGDFGMTFPIHDGASGPELGVGRPGFLDHGKVVRPHWRRPQNTTLSALIMLRSIAIGKLRLRQRAIEMNDGALELSGDAQSKVDFDISERLDAVAVFENSFAAHPLPLNVFQGPFDERWGENETGAIRRLYVGHALAAYEALFRPP